MSDGTFRLSDYGISTIIKKNKKNDSYVGSLYLIAPEISKGIEYNFKVDIWSIGITTTELANVNLLIMDYLLLNIQEKLLMMKILLC